MPPDPSTLLAEIDQLKAQIDALRPLPEHTVRTLHEQQTLEWTSHSNAIEGDTLSLKETKVVLEASPSLSVFIPLLTAMAARPGC